MVIVAALPFATESLAMLIAASLGGLAIHLVHRRRDRVRARALAEQVLWLRHRIAELPGLAHQPEWAARRRPDDFDPLLGELADALELGCERLAEGLGINARERGELQVALRRFDRWATFAKLQGSLRHDLATPINVMLGRATLLLRHPALGDELRPQLETMLEQGQRVTRLLEHPGTWTSALTPALIASSDAEPGVPGFSDELLELLAEQARVHAHTRHLHSQARTPEPESPPASELRWPVGAEGLRVRVADRLEARLAPITSGRLVALGSLLVEVAVGLADTAQKDIDISLSRIELTDPDDPRVRPGSFITLRVTFQPSEASIPTRERIAALTSEPYDAHLAAHCNPATLLGLTLLELVARRCAGFIEIHRTDERPEIHMDVHIPEGTDA